jgi:hypothetical protein
MGDKSFKKNEEEIEQDLAREEKQVSKIRDLVKERNKIRALVEDSNILGGNSITICNTRSIQESTLPMDISQLDVVVDIEGDVELLLGLGPY